MMVAAAKRRLAGKAARTTATELRNVHLMLSALLSREDCPEKVPYITVLVAGEIEDVVNRRKRR